MLSCSQIMKVASSRALQMRPLPSDLTCKFLLLCEALGGEIEEHLCHLQLKILLSGGLGF